jgi:hypothetical protein
VTLGFSPAVRTLYGGFPFLAQRFLAAFARVIPTVALPLAYNAS